MNFAYFCKLEILTDQYKHNYKDISSATRKWQDFVINIRACKY